MLFTRTLTQTLFFRWTRRHAMVQLLFIQCIIFFSGCSDPAADNVLDIPITVPDPVSPDPTVPPDTATPMSSTPTLSPTVAPNVSPTAVSDSPTVAPEVTPSITPGVVETPTATDTPEATQTPEVTPTSSATATPEVHETTALEPTPLGTPADSPVDETALPETPDIDPTPTPTTPTPTPTTPIPDPTEYPTATPGAGDDDSPLAPSPTPLPEPVLEANPSALDFRDVIIGTKSTASIELRNTGTAAATLGGLTLEGDEAFALSDPASGLPGTTLGAGDSVAVQLEFLPTAAEIYVGQLIISSNAVNTPQTIPLSGEGVLIDDDGDGVSSFDDCDDHDPQSYPGAEEIICDGVDQDCVGGDDEDADNDGYSSCSGLIDCNDANANVHPNAVEIACDGIDQDCDGSDVTDSDGDGFDCEGAGGNDCDDQNASSYPGAPEYYDGEDNDCDGQIDEELDETDDDGDGWTEAEGDCSDDLSEDENADQQYPGGVEIPYDGIDQDCSGRDLTDVDADGYAADEVAGGTDCDDENGAIHPGSIENPYDGIDEDCTGADLTDVDGDGFDASIVEGGTDCNDSDAEINPASDERCDAQDNNCDGIVDLDSVDQTTYYLDADGDGYGNIQQPVLSCEQGEGLVLSSNDCNDANDGVYPGAAEVCNSLDDDCDGATDEGLLSSYYRDSDGDSYGVTTATLSACSRPTGYAAVGGDCDDTNAAIFPGALELCNGIDDDCDTNVDEGVKNTYYQDSDSDGYGISAVSTFSCSLPVGYSSITGDCNDADASINPAATEVCNEKDDDCDSSIDEGVTLPFYVDADDDGYGSDTLFYACSVSDGASSLTGDCDDTTATISPAATEIPGDGIDQNCDGADGCASHGTFRVASVDTAGSVGYMPSLAYTSDAVPAIAYYDTSSDNLKYATILNSAWVATTPDATGDTGWWPSLAMSSTSVPHIAYFDNTNEDLRYATFANGVWTLKTIDSTGDVGYHPDLKLDSAGIPHIVYRDDTDGNLNYAVLVASSWQISTVEDGDDTGYYPTLTIAEDGALHAAWYSADSDALRYAKNAGNGWEVTTVDDAGDVGLYPRLVLDASGYPVILYFDADNEWLKLARQTASGWTLSVVRGWELPTNSFDRPFDLAIGLRGELYASYYVGSDLRLGIFDDPDNRLGAGVWWEGIFDANTNVGRSSSIRANSAGTVGVAYFDYSATDLKYGTYNALDASGTTSYWHSYIDAEYSTSWTSLLADSQGNPVIAYEDYTNGDLRLARYDDGWSVEVVESTSVVGYYPSLAVDSADNLYIAHFDTTNDDLRYSTNSVGYWAGNSIDTYGNTGYWPSIALDSNNGRHVAYFDSSNSSLRYARLTTVGWISSSVDSTDVVGYYPSMIMLNGTSPLIAYQDSTNADLKLAELEDNSWHITTVDSDGNTGFYPSMALSNSGILAISYLDAASSDDHLNYAEQQPDGSWLITEVDISSKVDVGYWSSLAFFGDEPYISYVDRTNYRLKIALRTDGVWHLANFSDSSTADDEGPRLIVGQCGEPLVSYPRMDPAYGGYHLAIQSW